VTRDALPRRVGGLDLAQLESAAALAQAVGGREVLGVAVGVEQGGARLHPVDPARPVRDLGLAQPAMGREGIAAESGAEQLLERECA